MDKLGVATARLAAVYDLPHPVSLTGSRGMPKQPCVPPPPEAARRIFGERLDRVEDYARLLSRDAVQRGLLGPREADRLWERHLMNCAAIVDQVPADAHVVDIGSGAGLPGIVLGLMRRDIAVTLLDPLLRRTVFLEECVGELGLDNVEVRRARAEELARRLNADVVTARAVAPLPKLIEWSLPLLRPGGRLLALKGERAEEELAQAREILRRWRVRDAAVLCVGEDRVGSATRVVRIIAGRAGAADPVRPRRRSRKK